MSEQVRDFYAKEIDFDNGPVKCVLKSDYDALHAEAEALLAENGRLAKSLRVANHNMGVGFDTEAELTRKLEVARGLLERVHDGLEKGHPLLKVGDEINDFLTATPAPEVPAGGPYASVADALAQRYPKPSLLKDCNVGYSNSSRPLAEQGERQGGSHGD